MEKRAEPRGFGPVVASVVRPRDAARGVLRRAGQLTPYAAEAIVEDVLHAGRGAHLELVVAPPADAARLALVRHLFAWLGGRGVQVRVRRGRPLRPASHQRGTLAVAPARGSR